MARKEKPEKLLLLRVSRHHLQNGKLGLSILSSWEAVIERLARIYRVRGREIETYKKLSALARKSSLKRVLSGPLEEFPGRMRRLSKFRNAIAHAEQCRPEIIAEEFPRILTFLEAHLGDEALDRLPDQMPLRKP